MWLFVIDAEASLMMLMEPLMWVVFCLFTGLAIAATRIRPIPPERLDRRFRLLLLLLIAPLLMTALAIWQYGALEGKTDDWHWQSVALLVLLLAQLGLAVWIVRRARYRALAIALGIVAIAYTGGSFLTAAMAISNTWI